MRLRFSAPTWPHISPESSSTSRAASSSSSSSARRQSRYIGGVRRRLLFLLLSIVATAIVLGFVFAGSPTTIANGVTIDGIDVGGMRGKDARALLQHRSDAVANKPVVFLAGGTRYSIRPNELGGGPDWKAAVP